MPSEPDKPIEELLKTYAKKRREQAGASFELHPATRKLLQGEVARQWRKPAKDSSVLEILLKFWPRIAMASGVVAVLGLVLWLANPRPEPEQKMAQVSRDRESDSAARSLAADKKEKAELKTDAPQDAFALDEAGKSVASASAPPSRRLGRAESVPNNRPDGARNTPSLTLAPPPNSPNTELFFNQTREEQKRLDSLGIVTNSPLALADGGVAGKERNYYSFGLTRTNPSGALGGIGPQSGIAANSPVGQASPGLNAPLTSFRALNENELKGGLAATAAPQNSGNAVASAPTTELLPERQAPRAAAPPTVGQEFNRSATVSAGVAQPQAPNANLSTAMPLEQSTLSKQLTDLDAGGVRGGGRARFSQNSQSVSRGIQFQGGAPVLNSFEVEQHGDRIRIYDADGSIYEGQLETNAVLESRTAGTPQTASKKESESLSARKDGLQDQTKVLQLSDTLSAQQNNFQATGTNRSLHQLVVIKGTLTSATNADARTELGMPAQAPLLAPSTAPLSNSRFLGGRQAAGSASAPALQQQSQQAPVLIQRIQGRAKVGATSEVQIDALRAPR